MREAERTRPYEFTKSGTSQLFDLAILPLETSLPKGTPSRTVTNRAGNIPPPCLDILLFFRRFKPRARGPVCTLSSNVLLSRGSLGNNQ